MSNKEVKLTVKATDRLNRLRPGLVCPFCHNEGTFIHQQREEPISYAISLFNHDKGDLQSAYSMDLISCLNCGYTMTFLPKMLERYLNSLEDEQDSGEEGGEDGDADGP